MGGKEGAYREERVFFSLSLSLQHPTNVGRNKRRKKKGEKEREMHTCGSSRASWSSSIGRGEGKKKEGEKGEKERRNANPAPFFDLPELNVEHGTIRAEGKGGPTDRHCRKKEGEEKEKKEERESSKTADHRPVFIISQPALGKKKGGEEGEKPVCGCITAGLIAFGEGEKGRGKRGGSSPATCQPHRVQCTKKRKKRRKKKEKKKRKLHPSDLSSPIFSFEKRGKGEGRGEQAAKSIRLASFPLILGKKKKRREGGGKVHIPVPPTP